jgi:hypothetical protein
MARSPLRWGRIVLGGVLGELLLIVAVIPLYAAGGTDTAITLVGVAGSYVAFVAIAWWLARPLSRPIVHGVLMGATAAVIYMAVSVGSSLFVADAPSVPPIYYLGHVLKLAGGATGGWLARRSATAPAAIAARL